MSYLDNSGVSYLWSKIKAKFAAITHTHSADDVTSGTLPIARGGTGAATAADAAENIVDGQTISPYRVAAAYDVTAGRHIVAEQNISAEQDITAGGEITAGTDITAGGDVIALNGNDVIIKSTDGTTNLHSLSNKANTSHTHAASDITSGTLPIARGGTGLSSSPSLLTNLGSTSAADVMQASPRPGVTGTLPVANGGTGVTSNPSMLANLGSTTADNVLKASPRPGVTGILAIGNGGSGVNGTVGETVVANIVSPASGCTIATAQYYRWGKAVHIFLGIKCTTAKTFNNTLATVVSGKRPITTALLAPTVNTDPSCSLNTDGTIQVKGSVSANGTLYVIGTYLLP